MTTSATPRPAVSRRRFLGGTLGAGAALGAGGLLSACGGGTEAAKPDGKLVFWHNYTQEVRVAFMEKAARAFEQAHPGTTVSIEVVPAGQFPTKWPAAQAANALPDVTTILPEMAIPMHLAKALNPMDDVLESLGGEAAFIDGLIKKLARYDDTVILLPQYAHNRLLIHRKDLLSAGGVTLPEKPTWDQAFQAAEKLQKPPQLYGWILKLAKNDSGGGYLLNLLTQSTGGRLVDPDGKAMLDTPEVLRATDYLMQLARKVSAPGQTGYGIADNFNLVATGKTAITEDGAAVIGNTALKDAAMAAKLGTTYFPRDTAPAHLVGSFGFALPKGKNPDLAKEFVKFMYSDAMYTPFLQTIPLFMFPTLKKANAPAFYQNATIAKHRPAVEQTLAGIAEGWAPGFEDGPNPYAGPTYSSHILEEALQSMLITNTPPKDALKAANQRLQSSLDDIKSRIG